MYKVGDFVQVIGRAKEDGGWVDSMDKYIGDILPIIEIGKGLDKNRILLERAKDDRLFIRNSKRGWWYHINSVIPLGDDYEIEEFD